MVDAPLDSDDARSRPLPPALALGCPLAQASLCVVSLHGRFGNASDGAALGVALLEATLGVATWQQQAHLCAPQAAGNKWYPHSFLFPLAENQPSAAASVRIVRQLVASLRSQLPPLAKLVLIGFSQGACLTCEVLAAEARERASLLAHPHADSHADSHGSSLMLDGAIAFTGGLMGDDAHDARARVLPRPPARPQRQSPLLPPVALITGDPDTHVPVQRVRETASEFEACGASVLLHITQGKRHVVLPSEVQLAAAWMKQAGIVGAEHSGE
jgi:phospholipase/carboxylesterase